MKITFIPKIVKRAALPLIAATTLTTTSVANVRHAEDIGSYELINIDTFERADRNHDNALDYKEFLEIKNINTNDIEINTSRTPKTEENTKSQKLFGMLFLAICIAAFGIVKDIQNKDNREDKRDSLF